MKTDTRKQLVERYKDGYRAVAEALTGATDAELDAHPAPGKWSAREIVHHLADSEMTSAIRLRLLIPTPAPAGAGDDQCECAARVSPARRTPGPGEWRVTLARRLFYDRPIESSLEALKAARLTTAEILE